MTSAAASRVDRVCLVDERAEAQRSTPNWLVTYGDMMSLLLVLFAFLFSLKTLRPARHVSLHSGYNELGMPVVLEVPFERGSAELGIDLETWTLKEGAPEAREWILRDLHEVARRVSKDSRFVILAYASPRTPPLDGESLDELSRRRARAVGAALESLLERRAGGCPVSGPECEHDDLASGERLCIIYGANGAALPASAPIVDPLGRPADSTRDFRDRVEICLLTSKLGRETGE